LDDFARLDVQVIGASVDSERANRKFAEKYDLRFPLICDTDYELSAAFGVARKMVGAAKRTTFVLDADGTVLKQFLNVTARGHAAEVLQAVQEIWG
jgi:peroxiredoxin Q/BCP